MGRSISTSTSGNVTLTTSSNLAVNDLVGIGPKGTAYKVSATDTASVSNINYGTAQTTAATGMIVAQTQINSIRQVNDIKRHAVLQLPDKSIVVVTTTAGVSTGLVLSRYSVGGALLGSNALDTTGNTSYTPRMFFLTNGNICVVYGQAATVSFAIVDTSLNTIKAVTTIETTNNTGYHDAVPLTGGGFAVSYQQQANSALQRLAIYDNSGNVVSAPATIQTWTGTAGAVYTYMAALSNGGVAIACFSAYTTTIGTYYGIWSATGVQVKAMTQLSSYNNASIPIIASMTGYFAICYLTGGGITIAASVFDNATGTAQGSPFTNSTVNISTYTGMKLLSDGTSFWLMWSNSTGNVFQLTKMPTTGTGYVTTNITTTGTSNYNNYLDAFYENGYIVGMSMILSGANVQNFLWVVDTSTGSLVSTSPTLFGVLPGTANSDSLGSIIPAGDYSFCAVYAYTTTASTNLCLGKYANTSVIGVSNANALANSTVPVQQAAGAYYCNTVFGSSPKAFDNSATNINGNKGTLLTNSVILKGM